MNDLKTLIDLCPGTRLPQYEPEIFTDIELTEYYLRKLCEQYDWYDHGDSSPCMAYYYSALVMESRWPEADHIIATDRDYRELYNRYFGTHIWMN